jgi:hypothetical protein
VRIGSAGVPVSDRRGKELDEAEGSAISGAADSPPEVFQTRHPRAHGAGLVRVPSSWTKEFIISAACTKFRRIEKLGRIDFFIHQKIPLRVFILETSCRPISDLFPSIFGLLPLPYLVPHNVLYDTPGRGSVKMVRHDLESIVNASYPHEFLTSSVTGGE